MTVATRFQTFSDLYNAAIELVELRIEEENGQSINRLRVNAVFGQIQPHTRLCLPLVSYLCDVLAAVAAEADMGKAVVAAMRDEAADRLADARTIMRAKGYEL